MDYSPYSHASTLSELSHSDRAEIEMTEIMCMDDELSDALCYPQKAIHELLHLIALTNNARHSAAQYPDRPYFQAAYIEARCALADHVVQRCLDYLSVHMQDRLAEAYETAQAGMAVEAEDNLCRARELIAGWR